MKEITLDLIKRSIPILLLIICIYSIRTCNEYKQEAKQAKSNLKVVMDTVTSYREVNGKRYAENLVLSLTINELKSTNTKLANDIKSLSKRSKGGLNGTSVIVVHDTIYSTELVTDSNVSFAYSDSCIDLSVDSGMLAYQIKPFEVTIIQRKEGNQVIASANYSGCGEIVGISSIIIEEKKKKKLPWFWIGLGSGVILRSLL
jgi:hypothetical protein